MSQKLDLGMSDINCLDDNRGEVVKNLFIHSDHNELTMLSELEVNRQISEIPFEYLVFEYMSGIHQVF